MNCLPTAASLRYSVSKSLNRISKQQLRCVSSENASASDPAQSSDKSHKILIPKRIERGPTDILKALSGTVKKDYLAPHYKYHDDPFLIPTSNMDKRMFALSQESGRKAAQWIRQEHADLFQHKVADPPIEVYFPKAVYDDNSEVNEEVLQKLITQHLVSDSVTVYGLLEQKGIELSRSTKQSLLELICYYNGQDPVDEDWIEERWFRQEVKSREKKMNTWKAGGVAEKLFNSLSPPDAASYSALLCGMAQFGNAAGAYKLYEETQAQGLALPVHAFNRLLVGALNLKESHELRWQFVEELLGTMKQQGVSPNLGTLNAVLEVLGTMSTFRKAQKQALAITAEFRNMGIEPSAASYCFLLNIFCRDRSNIRSQILVSILNILEGKSLTMRDPRDVLFFTEAMENCRFHLSDVDVAYRLDKLLHTADNYNLIGDSFKESLYYRNLFALVCQMCNMTEFMEMYDKLVPHIYVPEPSIMDLIIKTVDLNESWELLPRLWSDLVMFDQSEREESVCAMLTALQHSHTSDQTLLGQHADVAWAIWLRVEGQRSGDADRISRKKISWTGPMLGDVIQVLLRADRYQQAVEVISCLDKRQAEILGVPAIESLNAFLDKSIEKKEIRNAIWCIQYCYDSGFEDTVKMAQRLSNSVQLSDSEQSLLVNIVGQDALQKQSAASS